MAEPSTDATYEVAANFNITYLKDGLRSSVLFMDDELLKLIGLVTAHWGHFEFRFNTILEALITAAEIDEPGWKGLSFPKRMTRLRRASAKLYAEEDPQTAKSFLKFADDALELHWKRNIVVHGAYGAVVQAKSSQATYYADGLRAGKPTRIPLDHHTLEELWHGIAHLGGCLYEIFSRIGELEGFWPTLLDTEILRAYRGSHHR